MQTQYLPISKPLRTLSVYLPYVVNKMPLFYKKNYGEKMISLCSDMFAYVDLANREEVLSKRKGLLKTLNHKISLFSNELRVLTELTNRGNLIIDKTAGIEVDLKDSPVPLTLKQISYISLLLDDISKQAFGWMKNTASEK